MTDIAAQSNNKWIRVLADKMTFSSASFLSHPIRFAQKSRTVSDAPMMKHSSAIKILLILRESSSQTTSEFSSNKSSSDSRKCILTTRRDRLKKIKNTFRVRIFAWNPPSKTTTGNCSPITGKAFCTQAEKTIRAIAMAKITRTTPIQSSNLSAEPVTNCRHKTNSSTTITISSSNLSWTNSNSWTASQLRIRPPMQIFSAAVRTTHPSNHSMWTRTSCRLRSILKWPPMSTATATIAFSSLSSNKSGRTLKASLKKTSKFSTKYKKTHSCRLSRSNWSITTNRASTRKFTIHRITAS